MITISQVLCPIDFSEISRHALDHAAAIARWYEARLSVVYVFASLPAMDLPPLVLDDADRERLKEEMRAAVGGAAAGVPLDLRVEEAPTAHEGILAQLEATRADLLVIGTHGRSGFQRFFLGSVTEKVIRKAACPTLVVPPRAPEVPPGAPVQFRSILCPVDFSDSSLGAVAFAIRMAEEADARLTLLHVIDVPQVTSEEPAAFEADLERIRRSAAAEARRRLHDLIPAHAQTFCTVDTAIVEGRAYAEILRQAGERRAELIVMGVHGRGAMDRLLFGSTTHHVIRGSACPVLIVRQA